MAQGQGRSSEQGVKLLYIRDYLHKYTNKEHPKSAKDIIEYLASKGIKAERKTIYNDIFRLQMDFQEPIEYNPKKHGYYITEPKFSFYELQMLMDCVRSSNFLSSTDVSHISKKIGELANIYDCDKLRNVPWLEDEPVRPPNSELYNVALIQQAIEENRRISFRRYFYYPISLNRNNNGKMYTESYTGNDIHVVSPKELFHHDGHYFLACYRTDSRMEHIVFPVQYLENIVVLPSLRECIDCEYISSEEEEISASANEPPFSTLSKEEKITKIGGTIEQIRYMLIDLLEGNLNLKYTFKRKYAVTLIFKNEDAALVLNEFGYETTLVPLGGRFCSVTVRIPIQPQFFNWLFLNRSKIRIVSPERVVNTYCEYVEAILLQYEIWNTPSDELINLVRQYKSMTGANYIQNIGEMLDQLSRNKKSHFKLAKSLKKFMKVEES